MKQSGGFGCGTVVALVLASMLGARAAEDDAGVAEKRAGPDVRRSAVVTGQGYFPVAVRLADGRIAVVLRGGAPHLGVAGRLDIVFSADEGRTWSKPTVVNDSPIDDRNPAFGQAADGALVVAFWRTNNYDDKGNYNESLRKPVSTWVTRSADGGKTWSEPAQLDVADVSWGSPYGRILTLPDKSMLMNVYGGPVREKGAAGGVAPEPAPGQQENSYAYRSDDHGKTWRRFSTPGPARFNETALLRLDSGELLAAMRSAPPPQDVWLARSADGGKTWGEPRRATAGLVHPADLTLLPDGRVLLVAGCRNAPFGVRGVVGDPAAFEWEHSFTIADTAGSRIGRLPGDELAAYLLVYNLVRLAMPHAAERQGQSVWRISFVDAVRWPCPRMLGLEGIQRLVSNPLHPGRCQPRVIRRRMKEYDLMNKPRPAYETRENSAKMA